MGKIVISENVSLDGIVDDPTGEEGSGHGHWTGQISERDRGQWYQALHEEALSAQALLIGRRSDEWFARRWLPRGGEQADRLNGMPKYVVSSTLDEPSWSNATVLSGDMVGGVTKLKEKLAGDIVVYGSIQLAHALLEHGLADEVRMFVYPVVLGAGQRLFTETSDKRPLRLIRTRTIGENLIQLSYERAGYRRSGT
jgi:dihydrofolate reductase